MSADRAEMLHAAKEREVVTLADGRTARLVYWPGGRTFRSPGARARVQLPSGKYLSVPAEEVARGG